MSALDGINFPLRETKTAKCSLRWHNRQVARVVTGYAGNPNLQVGNPAVLIAVQRKAAPPPVAQYDAWLDSVPSDCRAKRKVTGARLRRAVVMQRDGYNISEIERATGYHGLRPWIAKLPPELAA
jgi:hypothetical protein